ncbi:MAG: hypothetical protein KA801_08875 [Syntrophorhabdaceae bacterium]|nr:hypothetical protein [Syntrophorhabdaceae bacterium]
MTLPSNTIPEYGWDAPNANELIDDEKLDPVTGFPGARSVLARIVKKEVT